MSLLIALKSMVDPNYWWNRTKMLGVSDNLAKICKSSFRQLFLPIKDGIEWIPEILPYALSVLGVTIAVFFAIKFIKKIMK